MNCERFFRPARRSAAGIVDPISRCDNEAGRKKIRKNTKF
jgi:hypothetical protein